MICTDVRKKYKHITWNLVTSQQGQGLTICYYIIYNMCKLNIDFCLIQIRHVICYTFIQTVYIINKIHMLFAIYDKTLQC
jgi:hypothetical protein